MGFWITIDRRGFGFALCRRFSSPRYTDTLSSQKLHAPKSKNQRELEMQQERDNRGGVEEMKQNQDRRLNPSQPENLQQPAPPPPQQPQKCPRCESLNTKFCYYNNYSLSQPRYFCKTCRRYWTQGGTLRNVPVGGGCRKGKRTKTSSSSSADNSNSRSHPQQLSQQKTHQNLTTSSAPIVSNSALQAIPSVASLYPGGGFLSSLAAIQSLNQPQSFNQNLSDNFGLLQGFNVPSFNSQQHQKIQQGQFYQIDDNRDHKNMEALHPSDQEEGLNIQHDWNQSFVNNSIPNVSDSTFWSINGGAAGNAAGSSMNPNQWPDLPGYGAPP